LTTSLGLGSEDIFDYMNTRMGCPKAAWYGI